jgi:hypothetical protein
VTHGTSARIRSKSRVLPPPRLILGSKAVTYQPAISQRNALLTGVAIRDHQAFAGHTTSLVDQHVCSLVVCVVGDKKPRRLGVVGIEGLDDLSGLKSSILIHRACHAAYLGTRSRAHIKTLSTSAMSLHQAVRLTR